MQVAYNPRLLLTYSKITSEARMLVQDSSAFARYGEVLTWAELHARAALVDQVDFPWPPHLAGCLWCCAAK